MEAFYNRFWINNGLAIDCQAAYEAVGNALPSTNYEFVKQESQKLYVYVYT